MSATDQDGKIRFMVFLFPSPIGHLVLKGSQSEPLNVINNLSCYADLHLD